MNAYKIIGRTNQWIANRDVDFKGKCEITLESGLSLKEAKKMLLDMYNKDYEDERPYCPNWGLAVIQSNRYISGARPTFPDGTRNYEYDSRVYSIEEDDFYRVDDTESGNYVIYEGASIEEAIESIIEDGDPELWDLCKNGDRIWCGKLDTINELKSLKK